MITILLKILVPFLVIFQIIPLLVWAERKGSAFIQDRHGPNRASFGGLRLGGLLHSLADVIKLISKEDIIPSHVHKPFYLLAPFMALLVACVTFAVIPFAHPLMIDGKAFTFQAADLNVGVLYILSMSSLGVFGVMLGGWASNNKYALLGSVRSSAQMISYEIAMGLSLLTIILMSGSLELNSIVALQGVNPLNWNIFKQPLAWIIFTTAAFAETNRNPFDLPEGESELVAGFHVEYSSMKFGMFFMAEYAHIIIASALISTLFFGGWQIPFLSTEVVQSHADLGLLIFLVVHLVLFLMIGLKLLSKYKKGRYGDNRDNEVLILGSLFSALALGIAALTFFFAPFHLGDLGSQIFTAVLQVGIFLGKILFFCWFFIWIRWTLPRFRFDQLMKLGWKILLPLALANLILTAVWLVL